MKTQYYTATSVDGFIADEHNSLDWLFEVTSRSERQTFAPFFAGVGAFAMGATTYEWVLEHERVLEQPEKWQGWYGDVPSWVFTHRTLPVVPGAGVVRVRRRATRARGDGAAAGGRNVWLVGGGELVGAFADAGLLDEVILGVAPVTLGAGAPVLPRRLPASVLSLVSVEQDGQFAYLTYTVRRGS